MTISRLFGFILLGVVLASLCTEGSAAFGADGLRSDLRLDELIEEDDEWVVATPIYDEEDEQHALAKRSGRAQQMRLEDLWEKHFWRTVAGVAVEVVMLAVILGVCLGVSSKIGALFLFVVFALHVLMFFFILLRLRVTEPVVDLGKAWGDVY
jgi:hypothetical protein